MAKKNKKIRKKKEKQRRIATLTFDELLNAADHHALNENFRDAIKMYKLALKNLKSKDQDQVVHQKLFLSYMQRAKELTAKEMLVESESLRKQAMTYLPDPGVMDLRTIAFVLELSDIGKAFDYIEQYLARKGKDPLIGVLLADRLVTRGGWDSLENRDAGFFISRDAPIVKACIPLMDKGWWQQASDGMKGLPRSSAFAHIRMFCRAMAMFGQGDDKNMYKAISMIPEASVFAQIAAVLGATVQSVNENNCIKEDKSLAACLWEGPLDIWETAEKIIEKEEKHQFDSTMKKLIITFSEQILPQDPEYARQYLVETLWHRGLPNEKAFMAFEKALLPKKTALLEIRLNILSMSYPLENAAKYLNVLEQTGTDPQTLAMVEAAIFLYVCRVAFSERLQGEFMKLSDQTAERFGLFPGDGFDCFWMQCAARAIQCDAGNRDFYELTARMNVTARAAKKIKEQLLLSMCEVFPDDPYPCIELASLYYGKNAFRKAENILKKAMKLAPYDSRVQDMHIISLVISADKGLNKGNYHSVWQDLEKAQALDTGANTLLLQEKELFYKICEQPEISKKIIESNLDKFSLSQRLKLVSMIRMDVQNKPRTNYKKVFGKIDALFKKEFKQVGRLTSQELLVLLAPFPREWQHAFASLKVHELFFQTEKGMLKFLNGDDLIRFMDQSLSLDNLDTFQVELLRRTRKRKKEPGHDLLKFYSLALEGISDDYDWDLETLIYLVENADPEMKKKLQAAGERLCRHTHGPFRHALRTLDFEFLEDLLDLPDLPFGSFDPFSDDDDDYDDDDDDDEFNIYDFLPDDVNAMEALNDPFIKKRFLQKAKEYKRDNPRMFREIFEQLKAMLELMVDEQQLRGASITILKIVKKELITMNDTFVELILTLNFMFLDEGKKQLSREAKALFIQ